MSGFRSVIRPVRAPAAKSRPRQVWEMLNWAGRLITTPNDYPAHGLHLKGKTANDALRFLSAPRARELMWPLNRDPLHLENKLLFESHFSAMGLPVPQTLAVIGVSSGSPEVPQLRNERETRDFLVETLGGGHQFVVKPIDRYGGVSIFVITGLDGGHFVFSNGDRSPIDDVVREFSSGTWLVQRRIIQHESLAELNSSSLNTLRLGTFRRRSGEVDIVFTKLRIGSARSQVDSTTQGGFSVRIDPSTGAFAEHAYQLPKHSLDTIATHPDSGVPFAGRVHPHWSKVVSTAIAFAQAAGDNRFIGWDVATTNEGPVFVEGNHSWDVQGAQIGSSGMLTDEFIAIFNSETGARIDVEHLPPFRPVRAMAELRRFYR